MSFLLPGEREPNYGKVIDLCIALGYGHDRVNKTRPYLELTNPLLKFRKYFVANHGLSVFPLQYDHPAAKSCALEFLNANERLFRSREHEAHGPWPGRAEDKKLILEKLAMLICTQEMSFRRNLDAKRKQEFVAEYSESERESPNNDQEIVDETTIRVIPKQVAQPKQPAQPKRAAAAPTNKIDATEQTKSDTGPGRSIERHLQYTYPIDVVYPDEDLDWFSNAESTRWPDAEQAFAFRYFHEKNLYTASKENGRQVKRFARVLQEHLGIEDDKARNVIIRARCKSLLKEIWNSWGENGSGFLSRDHSGACVKSSQFEKAWKYHRNLWIQRVHGGKTDGLAEFTQPLPPVKLGDASRKRLYDVEESPAAAGPSTDPVPSPKRPRHEDGEQRSDTLASKISELMGWTEPQSTLELVEVISQEIPAEKVATGQDRRPDIQKPTQTLPTDMDVDVEDYATKQTSQQTLKDPEPTVAPQIQTQEIPQSQKQTVSEMQPPELLEEAPEQTSQPIPKETTLNVSSQFQAPPPAEQYDMSSYSTLKDAPQTAVPEKRVEQALKPPSQPNIKNIPSVHRSTPLEVQMENLSNRYYREMGREGREGDISWHDFMKRNGIPMKKWGKWLKNKRNPKPSATAGPQMSQDEEVAPPAHTEEAHNAPKDALPTKPETFTTFQSAVDQTRTQISGITSNKPASGSALPHVQEFRKEQSESESANKANPAVIQSPIWPSIAAQSVTIFEEPKTAISAHVNTEGEADRKIQDAPPPTAPITVVQTPNLAQTPENVVPNSQPLPKKPESAVPVQPRAEQVTDRQTQNPPPQQDNTVPTPTPVAPFVQTQNFQHKIDNMVSQVSTSQYSPVVNQPAIFTPVQYEPNTVPRVPAFTPVNVVPSNGFGPNLQHHTSKMPPSRPQERDSGPSTTSKQSQRSRNSLPASTDNNGHVNSGLPNHPADSGPSRLPRSKSSLGLAFDKVPGSAATPAQIRVYGPPPPYPHPGAPITSPQNPALPLMTANIGANSSAKPFTHSPVPPPHSFPSHGTSVHEPAIPASINTNPAAQPNTAPAPHYTYPSQQMPQPHVHYGYPSAEFHTRYQSPQPFMYPPSAPPPLQHQQGLSQPPPPMPQNLTLNSTQTSPTKTESSPSTSACPRPLTTPRRTATPEPRLSSTPIPSSSTPSTAAKANLTFILENTNRFPDHDNPLSAPQFRSLSITAFFDLFCQRSGRDRSRTEYVVFKYNWGNRRDSLLVNEVGNDVEWKDVQERIRDTFLMTRDRVSVGRKVSGLGGEGEKERKWQVWVIGPEEEEEEEEEEW